MIVLKEGEGEIYNCVDAFKNFGLLSSLEPVLHCHNTFTTSYFIITCSHV